MLTKFLNKIVKGKAKSSQSGSSGKKTKSRTEDARPSSSFTSLDWKPGDTVDNRYLIENVMSGSMGKVFMAEHLGWKIKMAIKSPRPEVLADKEGMRCILNEANSWIKMGMHPNIAACYFVLALEGIPHLFIEYVDGGSLADWIKTGKCRDLRTAISLAVQFCHGMEYTHGRKIIHRDIKPQNILVTKNALLKITDFGIVLNTAERAVNKEKKNGIEEEAEETMTVGFRGTPGYAPPEQFQDAHNVDERSDLFSFGICMWLMFCGRKPFKKNFLEQPIPEPTPPKSGVHFPTKLQDLLKKSIAFLPEDRYQNFKELKEALNDAYKEAFKISCPYYELGDIDLRADSLNNRAVSLFELGKHREAADALRKTLEINDVLPEAVYNHILMQWKIGKSRPERLLRQIEAAKKTLSMPDLFKDLEDAVEACLKMRNSSKSPENSQYPEFRVCAAKKTLEIFRDEQMQASIRTNILDHLKNKRYKACHEVLQKSWKNLHYKRDKHYTRAYEELLKEKNPTGINSIQRLTSLKNPKKPVSILSHIPGMDSIITPGPCEEVLLRSISSPKKIKVLKKADSTITAMVVSPKSDMLAIGCEDGSIFLWSTKSRTETAIESHGARVTALAFNPDGNILAAGCDDGTIDLYELPACSVTSLSRRNTGSTRGIVFYNKGRNIASGSDDGAIALWHTGEKEFHRLIDAHALPISSMSNTTDSMLLASCSADRYVKVWDLTTGMLKKEIKAHEEAISSILMLPDKKHIISGCEDDLLRVWEIDSGKCLLTLNNRGEGVSSLCPGPKKHLFLSGGENGTITLWMLIHSLDFNEI